LVSTDAAAIIIRQVRAGQDGFEATPERVQAAEQALTELAATTSADVVAAAARSWRDALDPDGVQPRYDDIVQRSGLVKGREHNGITHWGLDTDPLGTALLDAVLEDSTTPVRSQGNRFRYDRCAIYSTNYKARSRLEA
jgi:hypothetical protein